MGYSPSDLADLVAATQDAYPLTPNFEYLRSTRVHSFELCNRIFREDDVQIQGGEHISYYVVYKENGTAQYVLPGEVHQPSIVNVMKKVTFDWARARAHYSVLHEEIVACRGPEKLIGLLGPRRAATQMDLSLMIEEQLWAAPDSSDEKIPNSLQYFIVPITTTQVAAATTLNGAFQGANPTGESDVGGLDASDATYARWRNWNAVSDNSSGEWTATVERRMGRMFRNLDWETPDDVDQLQDARFQSTRLYINETTLESAEAAAKAQNSQVGYDLGRYQGKTLYKGLPFKWQKPLDTYEATLGYYPVVMVNFNHLFAVVRSGDFFRETTFPADKYQPDVVTTFEDLAYNLTTDNRQLVGGVLSYVA